MLFFQRLTFICCFCLLFSPFPSRWSLLAQRDGVWVTGRGTAYLNENITPAEAKQRARRNARTDAIERALGVSITAEKFLQQFEISRELGEEVETGESFANYIRESRRGRIVDEETWQEKSEITTFPDGTEIVRFVAANRFHVLEEDAAPDPNFKLELTLSNTQYKEGEGVAFNVRATQDCYLTVFNIAANDSVYLIFPNTVERSNRQMAEQTRTLPGFGYSFVTALPPGREAAMESIVAVATKDSLIFQSRKILRPGAGYAEMWKTGLNEVWRWVAEIDADRRVEAIKSFKIYR
ncbi:MAG: DUF4384 domain-containing protein [bacterium]